jgi:hypothetical protein
LLLPSRQSNTPTAPKGPGGAARPAELAGASNVVLAQRVTVSTAHWWSSEGVIAWAAKLGGHNAQAATLSEDSSYSTGARCLLQWVRDNEAKFGHQNAEGESKSGPLSPK